MRRTLPMQTAPQYLLKEISKNDRKGLSLYSGDGELKNEGAKPPDW